MKRYIYIIFFVVSGSICRAQDSVVYHPEADAMNDVKEAVKVAAASDKNIMLMIGGNWCRWCRMFDSMLKSNASVDSALKANFVFMHVNFSKENRNTELMKQLNFPQRFGFPVFVVLDDKGKRIHTQNSEYLEKGEGYDPEKVIQFFSQWGKAALEPEQYNK